MMRGVNSSVETVNAAATAIITAEGRIQQATVEKRRWASCWSGYWCFGSQSHRHGKRIVHAVLIPEPTMPGSGPIPISENQTHAPTTVRPFIAPPSSPASFLQSEPASSTHSPTGLLSFTSLSADMYCPDSNPIFAVGPYANDLQLVSPPVFSTYTTEPNTAPVTPPSDTPHFTTPPSPEVPFARVMSSSLDCNNRNSGSCQKFPLSHYEFQSYHLYPGSPVGNLISPSSVMSESGTTSPYLDREFSSGGHSLLEFRTGDPPSLWNFKGLSSYKWVPRQSSGSLTPDGAGPNSGDSFLLENGFVSNETVIDHRVSFELTAKEVIRCMEKESVKIATTERDGLSSQAESDEYPAGENSSNAAETSIVNGEPRHRQQPSLTTIGSVREFKFENTDGGNSDWWDNEKVVTKEVGHHDNWTFFPMIQPGVS
ncbi:hypothetical protein GIB67_037288 [Kingdonia uniflora]|uniref:Uncharacterized protein n=1 Tax=Kingdonia uniflora TaxID=39325 RepID=A0A7J7MS38_9MAGN|nr:hypothetical protein GIB67_037288 [Kingdonia uniflora]